MNSRVCTVCSKPNASYRCPKCRAGYCSKECCKAHQEQTCPHYKELAGSKVAENQIKDDLLEKKVSANNKVVEKSDNQLGQNIVSNNIVTTTINTTTAVTKNSAPKLPTKDDRIITLTEEQKSRLRTNEMLMKLMGSKRLRDEFEKIDTATNRAETMKKMRVNNQELNVVFEKILGVVQSSITDNI